MSNTLGWCAKSVDALADRIIFDKFGNDDFDFNFIYNMNNKDVLFDSAILSSLVTSCSFLYISKGNDDFPRLQVVDGRNATGIIDPITNMLSEGYAVLNRDENGVAITEAYFLPHATHIFENGEEVGRFEHKAPYPLLVPIIYRPDAKRPFGHSRISRACMDIMQSAMRTIKRSEVSAEFYSFPQKYILGLSEDAEGIDTWKATMSSLLRFDKDEDGDHPIVGQFQQQSMTPYMDQLRTLASLFAGETGLTVDDLGFIQDNPSSAEAIKASHENLRLSARKAQRNFATGFINAGYLASCIRDDYEYSRNAIYDTKVIWRPIFEPDAAMLSSIGDGAIKINQAIPEYFTKETLQQLTGIEVK